MKNGFVSCAAASIKTIPCDIEGNVVRIIEKYKNLSAKGVKLAVFPELCITGYSCGDMFRNTLITKTAEEGVKRIADASVGLDTIVVVGCPLRLPSKLYNCAVVIYEGKILGLVPKRYLPEYAEFDEVRIFTSGETFSEDEHFVSFAGQNDIHLGKNLIFCCKELPAFTFAIEICEDFLVPVPPSISHALNGANIIVNASASSELVGKSQYRRDVMKVHSAKLSAGYIYCSSGEGESSSVCVFGGHNMIYEAGVCLAESKPFEFKDSISEIDCEKINSCRACYNTYIMREDKYIHIPFSMPLTFTKLTRRINPYPFIPEHNKDERWQEIIDIQVNGLKKRIESTFMRPVLNLSGGLDSTLAFLICVEAMKKLGKPASDIVAITQPCFGTTKRTRGNAEVIASGLGADFRCVDIGGSVTLHLKDIGHSGNKLDAAFENSQARERTQVAMDICNMVNGLMIGTGDMSELALGWCTYNGDHMSMYGINAGIPKSIMKDIIIYYADNFVPEDVKAALYDVCKTPVSPELLPPKEGEIAQKTEDINGPYPIHDFILYGLVKFGFTPFKLYRLAETAFNGIYDDNTIRRTFGIFFRRFFTQQFKRACGPDSVKVGSVAVTPSGGIKFPSDICRDLWMSQADQIADGTYKL